MYLFIASKGREKEEKRERIERERKIEVASGGGECVFFLHCGGSDQ